MLCTFAYLSKVSSLAFIPSFVSPDSPVLVGGSLSSAYEISLVSL